jgi:hypothetical protein
MRSLVSTLDRMALLLPYALVSRQQMVWCCRTFFGKVETCRNARQGENWE